MTKKDYKTLAKVFNRREYLVRMGDKDVDMIAYYFLLRKLVKTIREIDPRFDADRFIQEIG